MLIKLGSKFVPTGKHLTFNTQFVESKMGPATKGEFMLGLTPVRVYLSSPLATELLTILARIGP